MITVGGATAQRLRNRRIGHPPSMSPAGATHGGAQPSRQAGCAAPAGLHIFIATVRRFRVRYADATPTVIIVSLLRS